MSDMVRSCLGVVLLFVSIGIALIVLFFATFVAIWLQLTGNDLGSIQIPSLAGFGVAALFFIIAIYLFVSIRDYSWLSVTIPGVISGLYAILPDLLTGQPTDDIVVLLAGAGLSALLAWRKRQQEVATAIATSDNLLQERLAKK